MYNERKQWLMLAQVTTLRYWKSEHSEETCEDASGENTEAGLFAVADGVGTTLFSDAWANFLVRHYLHIPLLSNDPFEVEWWIRLAQEQFKHEFPINDNMAWNAQQKIQSQGSYTTLATLRFSASDVTHTDANVLVFGDSCVLVSNLAVEHIFSFPLRQAEEFERAPICIPSKPGAFNRYFHQCHVTSITLAPPDVVVIATDAVAKWIVSAGGGRYSDKRKAFQEVVQQTTASWPNFIQECRANKEMVDDDSTALIVALFPDTASQGITLGTTTSHSQPVRESRKQEFMRFLKEQNKERAAICFGDGTDLLAEGVQVSSGDMLSARKIADAQREVLAILRQEINNPNVVAIMTPVWQKYAYLLYPEPCAENIRKTLSRLGVPIEPIESIMPVAPLAAQEPVEMASPSLTDEPQMLHTQNFDVAAIQRAVQSREQEEEV